MDYQLQPVAVWQKLNPLRPAQFSALVIAGIYPPPSNDNGEDK